MRLAVIDCGTNTFNLMIVDLHGHSRYSKIYNTRIPVKLGEGAINKGFIAGQPFQRGLNAIGEFKILIHDYAVEKTLAYATSAIRDASNGREFVEKIKLNFDIDTLVIDGEKEAELIYKGVKEAVHLNESISLIMDIGGGSTELIIADQDKIYWKGSFNIGAARLLAKFKPSDPINNSEIQTIEQFLFSNLEPFFEALKLFPVTELIGSSGAFDSIVEMIQGELNGEPFLQSKTEYHVDLNAYVEISKLVHQSTLKQREEIKGLVPMRFDMIVISCLMIDFILKTCGIKKMRVSTYSLKEGALKDFIDEQS
jgi:exopolyphosphatase/guanosine-5'-triphosphate,3'-diphosphate pyrophosphatase